MPRDKAALPTTSLTCDLGIQHTSCTPLASEDRKALLKQVKAGEVSELEFDAIVFAALYPKSNFLRFYDRDLAALAASFSGQPFLRNHDVHDIGSRNGTILHGNLVANQIYQRIRLTSERSMLDFLQDRIDRFSIGWYFDDIDCSICQDRWMECDHWLGQHYKGAGKDDPEQTCELVFVTPRGKETSAVNAPAVKGTKVLDGLTIPKTIMAPRHLENTTITLLATERVLGSGNNDINTLVVDGGSQEQRMVAARRMLGVPTRPVTN